MPPVRALGADDHELFAEPFSVDSMLAAGRTLLVWVAAAALVVVAVGVTTAVPRAQHVDATLAAHVVAAPSTFVPRRAPVIRPARQRHPSPKPKPAPVARPSASTVQPVTAIRPAAVRPPAPAVAHARPRPAAPTASHVAPAPVSLPRTPAPPAAPPAPAPAPVETPHPVVPPLPPLPPVTDPQQPDVDRPSLPLGP